MYQLSENYSLKKYNTFGIEAKAKWFLSINKQEDFVQFFKENTISFDKIFILGAGSNILFTKDFDGLIIYSQIKGIDIISENDTEIKVQVGSGVVWDDWVKYSVEKNWFGLENLSYIPGTVGASPVQNVGAFGVEAKDTIYSVEAIDIETFETEIFTNKDCNFAYRNSFFKESSSKKYFITSVVFQLSKKEKYHLGYGSIAEEVKKLGGESLKNIRQAIINIRKSRLPEPDEIGSAGSFFKNTEVDKNTAEKLLDKFPNLINYPLDNNKIKLATAWLIDQCGWKGKKLGNAGVHSKQALVIINCGNAKGFEIVNLSKKIEQSVWEKFQVNIEKEVIII